MDKSAEDFLKHFRGCSNHKDEPRMVQRAHWATNRLGDLETIKLVQHGSASVHCKCTPSETKSADKSLEVTIIPFLDFIVKSCDITWPIGPIKVL